MFPSGILLAAQANAGEIKTPVILISNEMPDENTDQNTTQPPYRLTTCFSVISNLTPEQSIHDEKTKFTPVGEGGSGRQASATEDT